MTGSKLQTLIAQRARLDEARRARDNAIRAELKKQQDRKMVLLGAYLLERMGEDSALRSRTRRELDGWLCRAQDRALFELDPSASTEPAQPPSVQTAGEQGGVKAVTGASPAQKAGRPAERGAGTAQQARTSTAARSTRDPRPASASGVPSGAPAAAPEMPAAAAALRTARRR